MNCPTSKGNTRQCLPSVLICGHRGQLGRDLVRVLKNRYPITAWDLAELDITDPYAVWQALHKLKPEVIVNCAAFTAVDACETQVKTAMHINGDGPRILAINARRYGCRLIHVSTDYVFDGLKPIPACYLEEDSTQPLSEYGKSKLAGETAIRRILGNHLILRTAWLYGADGNNFLKTMLRLAISHPHQAVKVVNDQYGSPTWSYRLARQIERLLRTDCRGTYHTTAEGYCTWYELACHFLDRMGVSHKVVPCGTQDYPTPAKRPENSILENRRLKRMGLNLMINWRKDLDQFIRHYRKPLIDEVSPR